MLDKIKSAHVRLLCVSAFAVLAACAPAKAPVYDAGMQQYSFSTPQQAVIALIEATRKSDKAELHEILGPQADTLISSGDPVADKEDRERFLASYDKAHRLENAGGDKEILIVGGNDWPWPIPLVRQNGGWRFDTGAGEQEILDRRIGRNELDVIQVCRIYVDAQREYADQHAAAHGRREYAQRFISHSGRRDGLYWPVNEGEAQSPLGPLIAYAEAEGYDAEAQQHKPKPYHGYYYKILTGQTGSAPGGAVNYISGGHMTKGFALLAFPAKYGDSGVMTFIVNQDGIVYEKDLGPDTATLARQIKKYNPDKSCRLP